jgi:hypothetical protein
VGCRPLLETRVRHALLLKQTPDHLFNLSRQARAKRKEDSKQVTAFFHYSINREPFFVLAFGGLGLYGGHDDFFLFLQRVMGHLHSSSSSSSSGAAAAVAAAGRRQYRAVGAQEMVRLATQAGEARPK